MHNISGIKALPQYMHQSRFANWPVWGRREDGGGHRGARDRTFSTASNTGSNTDTDEVRTRTNFVLTSSETLGFGRLCNYLDKFWLNFRLLIVEELWQHIFADNNITSKTCTNFIYLFTKTCTRYGHIITVTVLSNNDVRFSST